MKNTYIIILISALTTTLNAQIVTIPDANFKNALVNTNCVDTDGNGSYDDDADTNDDDEIQVSEAEAVVNLSVSDQSIVSMEGIQSFVNLEILRCNTNPLTSLDVTNNVILRDLICYSNQLTSLDVTQNLLLETLSCGPGQITNLDISQNSNLEYLNCSFSQLTVLNVGQNPNLWWLSIENNQLTSLDISQFPNLENLWCESNPLTNLDLSQNPNLSLVWCGNSQLTTLDLSQNTSLQNLSVSESNLTSLDLRNGNNLNMFQMWTFDNPELTCILIDDENATYPTCDLNNLTGWCKDVWTDYSENCDLGIEDLLELEMFSFYPNPVTNNLNISNNRRSSIFSVQIYDITGGLVLLEENYFEEINLINLIQGIYLVRIETDKDNFVKKILKM